MDEFSLSQDEWDGLRDILYVHYGRMLRSVHFAMIGLLTDHVSRWRDLTPDQRHAIIDRFRLDDAATRRLLVEASHRLVGIGKTTEDGIMAEISKGQAAGYSFQQIADGVPEDNYRGISGLFDVTWRNRPTLVSRTELQHSQLISSFDRYRNSGGLIREVEIRDGGTADSDGECNARNGTRVPVESRVDLLHPQCTVSTIPVLSEPG